ncbi:formate dehydrogenase, alpha subunit, archaeal-type [Terriglobus roseus DSM 18391]|uniref:nitrate reductase (cytochrome) n=1 Tax=Terriglobus roseus (strain DSM 18391 / NRRL B-41598 / KBS 63) TaxID=926566 RepID=I3ZCM8_TERRK|nr:formate dehydrogenase subunit alpha [Terriglobus roseus]AFL86996.1 formate dehydrogenase, alpha subunit, archaeal-type [Terriglobus roseus DSM 18391]
MPQIVTAIPKRLLNTPLDVPHTFNLSIDGREVPAGEGELLIEVLNRAAALANASIADAGFHTGDKKLTPSERAALAENPQFAHPPSSSKMEYPGTAEDSSRAEHAGNYRSVPQLCYLQQMGPIQTCDTCMVEVDGQLVRACATVVRPGMKIFAESARADRAQREAMDRVLQNHDLYCTVCDNNNGNCTIHNAVGEMHVVHQERPFLHKPYEQDHSNPFYRYDADQCILCGRCVEACQDVQVNETLSIDWTSKNPRVLWDGGEQVAGSSCVSCGHCITVCPCNALMEKSMLQKAGTLTNLPASAIDSMIEVVKGVEPETGYPPILALSDIESTMREAGTKRTKTVCTFCGVGCSFEVWTRDRHILKIEPTHGPANGISTCVKGKFGYEYTNSKARLHTPLIRVNDGQHSTYREASWEEALTLIASRFTEIKQAHGPDALAFIASSKCTNEESYLMQKLARAVVGTNNVDNCSRYCQTPATMGLSRTVKTGGDSGSIADIEKAGLVLIVGSNTSESHPVLATRVKRSHKLRGQRLIVSDIRKHEMAERADLFIRPTPGTDLVWVSAVTKYIIDQGWHAKDFIEQRVNHFDEYYKSLESFTLEYAEKITSISVETLKQVAEEVVKADGVCILWAMGVTQHCGGSDTSTSLANLLLATGNFGRPGAGAYPLRGHNNVQGASDFGSLPNFYPGYQGTGDAEVRAKFEAAWGVTLPVTKGKDNHEMIDAIMAGELHSLYIKGEDTITSDSNANFVEQALSKIPFLVVQDIFFSETARYADVVLPASPSLEKDGTFTSTERRIQRLYKALDPLGDSKPDWEIIQLIANRLGGDWKYNHPGDIMDEVASLTPIFAGVTYERLEGFKSLQWPVAEDGTDSPVLFLKEFPFPDGKAKFFPLEWIEPSEEAGVEFDLHLNNGRVLEHFEQGAMTSKVDGINRMTPLNWVEVSPELAAARGMESGTKVEVESRWGMIRARVLVTDRVQGNELYMPMNSVKDPVNRLTGAHVDRATHTPAYKETAVRLRVLEAKGRSPLMAENFRNGVRTPQNGVEVERKWAQATYRQPGTAASETLVQINTTTV